MKYFSLDCVSKAYSNFQGNMTNKSWGLLCIMKQLDSTILQGRTYKFNCSELSNYIERLFCLSNEKKNYVDTGKLWYIKFSTQWHTFFLKQGRNLPNIFDLIIWAYRKEQMPDDVTDDYLVAKFVKDFNLSSDTVANIFDIEKREISYDNSLYSDSDLLTSISNGENDLGINITAEKKSVTAAVGELSRGPFIQPLYAALDTTDYFLISQVNFDEMYPFNEKEYKDTFNKNLQQIYYGAPGTGKSHTIKKTTDAQPKENVFRTTFHPDSDYSTFVGCYKPTMAVKPVRNVAGDVVMKEGKEVSERTITYSFTPQSFSKAYIRAWQTEEPVYLVIEEINRGNCAQIFGDLFQLLDRGDNGYSEYPIKADNDLAQYLAEQFSNNSREDIPENVKSGEELMLPSNLHIWATMNTSDQSLFPIDSAFKRRWDWEYEPIKYKNTDWVIEIGGSQYSWTSFQKEVNNKIFETTNSEDKMLGDYFVNPRDGIISKELLLNKILFYLWNDVCKDGDGDIFKTDEDTDVKFSDLYGDNGTNMLLSMMKHLKVSLLSGSADTADGEEVSDETAKQQGKSTLISIQLPNNPKILSANSTQFDAFVEALRVIGTDKIISVLPSLEYKRLGCPVISSQKEEGIINNNNRYSYHQEGNLFIIKGCKNYTYIRILEDLNELLNIGLSLETK